MIRTFCSEKIIKMILSNMKRYTYRALVHYFKKIRAVEIWISFCLLESIEKYVITGW